MHENEPTLPEESLFLQALEIDSPDEQSAFLNRECGSDAELRRAIEALLRHNREGSSYLEVPPTEVVAAAAQLTTSEAETPALDFLSPSNDPLSLGRLGYYEVVEVLGRGGFGVVLKARDTKLDRIVAVKTLAQSLASSATARKRFVREAKAAAAVKHENVVGIHHVSDEGPVPYLVMECVNGVSLEAKLQQAGALDLPAILRIGTQVASGLAAAHKQGLVHRDVKPGNILLENGVERVKITDFGLARAADDVAITRTGEVAGTPQYMSPEQAQGLSLDARSDLFSLGSVLYAMGTGRSPFRAESTVAALRRVCDDTPRPIREVNRDIPDCLADIINRLLAKQPSERFQTATDVAELLGWHLAHVQQSAIVPSPKPTIAPPRQPSAIGARWWSVALIALVAVACAIGLTEASGVTKVLPTVIRIVRGEGTLVIEVDDPTVQVSLDGEALSIRGAGLQELRLLPGQYRLHATKDGQPVKDEIVTISRDGRKVVTVTLESPGGPGSPSVAPAVERTVGELKLLAKLDGHTDWVRVVAFLPDGRRMVSVGYDELLRIWDLPTRSVLSSFSVEGTTAADVSAEGRLVAGVWRDDSKAVAHVWDIENGKVVCQFAPEMSPGANCIRFTPDGTRLVTSSQRLRYGVLWDAATGRELGRFDAGDTTSVHQAAFSPDGRLLAIGAVGRVRLFDTESTSIVGDVRLPTGRSVSDLVFAPNGRALATGQTGGRISLIDVNSRGVIKTLQDSDAEVRTLQFLDNDRFLLTSSYDAILRLWDLERERVVARAETENGSQVLFVSRDGRQVISAGGKEWDGASRKDYGDYALRLWQLPESVWPAAPRPTSLPADKTNQTPKPEAGAFVHLGGKGIAERKFDTLAEAVQRASDGDTIEIRGNGPFVSDPVNIRDRALTIRAGAGFRPVIKLSSEAVPRDVPLLATSAPLVLEGLELTRTAPEDPVNGRFALIKAHQAPLRAANCGFSAGIYPIESPVCVFRNCEFFAAGSVGGRPGSGARVVLENCLRHWKTFPLFVEYGDDALQDMLIEIKRCTFVSNYTPLSLEFRSRVPVPTDGSQASNPIRLEVSDSIFDTSAVLGFNEKQDSAALRPADAEAALLRLLLWRGRRNLFAAGSTGIKWHVDGKGQPPHGPKTLEEWTKFWGGAESDSLEGRVRFQGGNLVSRTEASLDQLTPDDFRLRADSVGYRAGPDGKDLGADVDLVGPGPAYERWKQTPEYQEWLKDSGQLKDRAAVKPEPGAFVVLGGKGVAERKFDTLADAVQHATDGDTIEVRGNGPFVSLPIKITVPLSIRAAAGFRPVIERDSTESPNSFIEAGAPLVLEGLELRWMNSPRQEWSFLLTAFKDLHAANCKFVTRQVHVQVEAARGPYRLELRNCAFLAPTKIRRPDGYGDITMAVFLQAQRKSVLDNCLFTGKLFMARTWGYANGAELRLTQCTLRTPADSFQFNVQSGRGGEEDFASEDWTTKAIQVDASGNVIAADGILMFAQQGVQALLPPGDAENLVVQMVGWRGERNFYACDGTLLRLKRARPETRLPPPLIENGLAGWKQLWGTAEEGSVEGPVKGSVRFMGGDLLAKADAALERLTPDDFRLRADSAGYRAGPGGKDLGADVDLIGPGAAYERWKQMPAYQEWLRETGQMK